MNNEKTSSSFSRKLIIIGAILIMAPPIILFIKFGNNAITGLIDKMIFLTPLFILSGAILFALGALSIRPTSPEVISKHFFGNPTTKGSAIKRIDWIGWLISALFLIYLATIFWHDYQFSTSNFPDNLFLFMPIFMLILIIITKYFRKIPWFVVLIGDYNMIPKDERETSIMQKAGQYTLAVTITILIGLFTTLMIFPNPSVTAILYVFIGFWSLIRAIYGFIAWRLGLK